MNKNFSLLVILLLVLTGPLFAQVNSSTAISKKDKKEAKKSEVSDVAIPIYLQLWHDRISEEQNKADARDDSLDRFIRVDDDLALSKAATSAIFDEVNELRKDIELSDEDHRHKVLYLNSIFDVLHRFNKEWERASVSGHDIPQLISTFSDMLEASRNEESIAPLMKGLNYNIGAIVSSVFSENEGYREARSYLLRQYAAEHPEDVLNVINASYTDLVGEPFVDSLIADVARLYPVDVYNYATSYTVLGRQIRENPNPLVHTIVEISESQKAVRILPFVDYIIDGTYTISELRKKTEDEDAFYKLSVKTLMDMNRRELTPDKPIGLEAMEANVTKRAMRYIRVVNELHESTDNVRFNVAAGLTPQEIYYVLINGQEEIYTSSFVGLFKRMMAKMKPKKGDQFLVSLVFDHFRKFITLSAAYNTLDDFLATMEPKNADFLMRKFVTGLQNSEGLEDAVDVADAFASIKDPKLLASLQKQIKANFQAVMDEDNERGKVIYGLLSTLFSSKNPSDNGDEWAEDMAKRLNLPPLDYIPFQNLTNAEGHVYQEIFFYGDKDGFMSYNSFMNSMSNSNWKIQRHKYWDKITSTNGKPITIFVKKPMDTEDEEGMAALQKHLKDNNINPTVFIHRGHSYHVNATLAQLQNSAKLVLLGSCGGYNSLSGVLNVAPDAQIITSKQTGAMGVNEPIIQSIETHIREGQDLKWEKIWNNLNNLFKGSPSYYELFQDYIPPQENLGAVFIKAYNQLMGIDPTKKPANVGA